MTTVPRYKIILGFTAIYLIWGSTYLAIRIGVEAIPPFIMGGMRFLIGGILFYLWGVFTKAAPPTRKQWLTTGIIGIMLLVGGNGLVNWAEKSVPSGITALIIALVPIWLVIFDWLRPHGQKVTGIVVVGLIIGFGGIVALINPTNFGGWGQVDLFGAILLLLATMFWSSGSIYSRYADQPDSKIVSSGMQMLTASMVLFILSLTKGEWAGFSFGDVSLKAYLALGYLITFGSVGFGAYIWLMRVSTPSKVGTYAYVNPVIALILGAVIAGETLSVWTLGCSVFILIAVILIISSRKAISSSSDSPPLKSTEISSFNKAS